jgi:hypothetical protein
LGKLGLAFSVGDQFTCSVLHSDFLGLFLCDTPVHQRHPFNSTVCSQLDVPFCHVRFVLN